MKHVFQPDWVDSRLAIGPAPLGPEDYRLLKEIGISFILSLQEDKELRLFGRNPDAELSVAAGFGLSVYKVQIEDFNDASLLQNLDEAVETLSELIRTGGKVYLHCAHGLNRSPTVAAAFLMETTGVIPEEAIDRVTAVHASMPNIGVLKTWYANRRS